MEEIGVNPGVQSLTSRGWPWHPPVGVNRSRQMSEGQRQGHEETPKAKSTPLF